MENPRTKTGSLSCSSSDALTTTLYNSIQALGHGFDVTSDIRFLYCKGAPGARLVQLDEDHAVDVVISDGVVVRNVPTDIEYSRSKSAIERVPVCTLQFS